MKFYTGIGSRNVPKDIYDLMREIGFKLNSMGWTLRSGGADGADTAFELGVIDYTESLDRWPTFNDANIYIPWKDFKHIDERHEDMFINVKNKEALARAEQIASEIHPNWYACSRGAKALHTRNVFQVVGHWDSEYLSKFVICWAPIQGDSVKGGTRTAVELAKLRGIEIFNLADKKSLDKLLKFMEE